MTRRAVRGPLVLTLAAVLAGVPAPVGRGCAVAPRPGHTLHIAEESAILVWDAASKTQHFIRRATFETASPDFGFLVPTPAPPALAEASDAAFAYLENVIRPKVVERYAVDFVPLCGCGGSKGDRRAAEKSAAVRVLHEQRVAGYDAAVLEADATGPLTDWLAKHGYPASPELQSWLAPYVAARWKVTAFKIAHDPTTGRPVQAAAVRMSFPTDRPFFPYREPAITDPKSGFKGSRLLRVFFLTDARMAGTLGPAAWGAAVPWADRLTHAQCDDLRLDLDVPAEHLPANAWLTAFEDPASHRPGAGDVFFDPAADQSAVRPPPIDRRVALVVPAELALLAAGVGGVMLLLALRRWARRGRAATSPSP